MLGGTAGDDLFSGYRRHQALNFENFISFLPRFILVFFKKIINLIPSNIPFIRRVKKITFDIDKPLKTRIIGYFSWLKLYKVKELFLKKRVIKNYKPLDYLFNLLNEIPNEKNNLNKMLYLELKSFLPDHNLNYTDKMSMAVGIETRVPFLDIELVEFSKKVPPKFKMKGKETKYILKKVAERYLPRDIIYRSKTGFGAPVRKWILGDMRNFIKKRLSKENIKHQGVFNYEKVLNLIEENKKGKLDASYSIWSILAISSWLNQFLDNSLTNDENKN